MHQYSNKKKMKAKCSLKDKPKHKRRDKEFKLAHWECLYLQLSDVMMKFLSIANLEETAMAKSVNVSNIIGLAVL